MKPGDAKRTGLVVERTVADGLEHMARDAIVQTDEQTVASKMYTMAWLAVVAAVGHVEAFTGSPGTFWCIAQNERTGRVIGSGHPSVYVP
jgi:hypothetical protein